MARRRRDMAAFSMSFLDCICCGFGAIILLFVLSKSGEPVVIEQVSEDLSSVLAKLQEELFVLRGETAILNRDLEGKVEQLSDSKEKLARLQGDLSDIKGEFSGSDADATVQNKIEGTLAEARQELTEEMKRLLANLPQSKKVESVGGIPVDSEYIVFIIDTSGSMKGNAWPMVMTKMRETLDLYPKVKGIQVMNDMGNYMFSQYKGTWIPDTPARRSAILKTLATWESFSNSSPVEGINAAIRDFYASDKKISLYIFGDEFSGNAMQPVVDTVARMNKANDKGEYRVRIHGVGFPVMLDAPPGMGVTGYRFATLMRALCERNGGTFVGLNSL
ncbi:MAG: hypothetical protein ACI9TH_003245 [Kiritimatiellia bacterium]|jgi:hypothetical protein